MQTKLTCTRSIEFDAGHRVLNHESKCAHLHGHRYKIMVTAAMDDPDQLDGIGRVIDFGQVKRILGGWIDSNWDHGMLLHEDDPIAEGLRGMKVGPDREPQKVWLLPYNPTAENIARYLIEDTCPELFRDSGITIIAVRVWETPNCYADASLEF